MKLCDRAKQCAASEDMTKRLDDLGEATVDKFTLVDGKAAELLAIEALFKSLNNGSLRTTKVEEARDLLRELFPSVALPPKLALAMNTLLDAKGAD